MSIITLPTTLAVAKVAWSQQRRDMNFSSPFGSQAVEISTPLWAVTLTSNGMIEKDSGIWKALLMQLRGRTNQLELWDMTREQPRGTMRGTMTLNVNAAQGAASLDIIAAGQAGTTLKAGDMLGLGSGITQQVVMVVADALADGSGLITVSIEAPLRNAFAASSAVTWNKPTALFRSNSSKNGWEMGYGSEMTNFTLDMIEDWRPS
jgi:hypothetical protein